MSVSAPILEARALALGYGRRVVVRDATLSVHAGEYWFLLGPNGTGKTTLLRTLLGALPPLGGTLVRGADAGAGQVGFVPQHSRLTPILPTTVGEVVRLGLVGLDVARTEKDARIAEALALVGLDGMAADDYWALSGGQQQRTLVGRALARRPRMLVLDEPMSGLDLVAEDRLLPLLAEWNLDGLTILYVTHQIALARRYASHVGLFARGSVITGERAAVLTPANLEATYGVAVPDEVESVDAPLEGPSS